MKTIELCAGAGGQALGLHNAGFKHEVLIELDMHACETLKLNNSNLNLDWGEVLEVDLKKFAKSSLDRYRGKVDLVAGGVPCPPFSKAELQLGKDDERDLFPTALKIVQEVKPSRRKEMAQKALSTYGTSIRLVCLAFASAKPATVTSRY
jgi:DNA (cytosine-5)-methyltransferase 1